LPISGGDTINQKLKPKKKYKYVRETEVVNGHRYEARGKTRAEARKKLAAKIEAASKGDVSIGGDMTVGQWVSVWLSTYCKPRIRKPGEPKLKGTTNEATYKEAEQRCRLYIVPAIGNLKIKEVTTPHLQKILNDNKDSSFSLVSKLSITIKRVFRQAAIDRVIPYDPSVGLVLPAAKKGKRRSLSDDERNYFLKAADKNRHGLLFRFLAATGLRPNELAALRVGSVDIDKRLVHVTQAVETGTDEVSTPKTDSGVRFTVINTADDPTIAEDIRTLIGERDADEFLFTKKNGGMLSRQALKIYWASFSRTWDLEMGAEHTKQGHIYDPSDLKYDGTPLYPDPADPSKPRDGHRLPQDIVPYCLRHTFGTDMKRRNVPIEVTKYLMGHSDITTTSNIYQDSGIKDAIRAVDILDTQLSVAKNVANSE